MEQTGEKETVTGTCCRSGRNSGLGGPSFQRHRKLSGQQVVAAVLGQGRRILKMCRGGGDAAKIRQ